MSKNYTLALKAAALARSNKMAWDEFLVALEAHIREAVMAGVQAPASEAQVNQGRAQGMVALHTTLSDALATATKLEQQKLKG